jgi:hypothetical protein
MTGLVQPALASEATACASEFECFTEETVLCIERAVTRIVRADNGEAGLRELGAFLHHILAFVKRDPGLEIAARDLYNAAAMIVASRPASSTVVDARPWRLLTDAAHRLRARLNVAVPRQG